MNFALISIIIATRNREPILWQTVAKAVAAIEGKNAEILVVNDGDRPLSVPAHIEGKMQCWNNPSRGVSAARNFGAKKAEGSVLFFVDDDMWIVPEVFDWITKTMASGNKGQFVYNVNWQYPDELDEQLQRSKVGRFLLSANYDCMWGRMKLQGKQPSEGLFPCRNIASCSLVMPRHIFLKLGGYKEDFLFQGEDIDLSNRLQENEIPVYATFDVTLFHNHQDRLEIAGFLDRLKVGYQSEFKASAAGLLPNTETFYSTGNQFLLKTMAATEQLWLFIYKAVPNSNIFRPVSNKMIGMLAGLQKFKQWKKYKTAD